MVKTLLSPQILPWHTIMPSLLRRLFGRREEPSPDPVVPSAPVQIPVSPYNLSRFTAPAPAPLIQPSAPPAAYAVEQEQNDLNDWSWITDVNCTEMIPVEYESREWMDVVNSMGTCKSKYRLVELLKLRKDSWARFDGTTEIGWHGFGDTNPDLIMMSDIGLDPGRSKPGRQVHGAGTYVAANLAFSINPMANYVKWFNGKCQVFRVRVKHGLNTRKSRDVWCFSDPNQVAIEYLLTLEKIGTAEDERARLRRIEESKRAEQEMRVKLQREQEVEERKLMEQLKADHERIERERASREEEQIRMAILEQERMAQDEEQKMWREIIAQEDREYLELEQEKEQWKQMLDLDQETARARDVRLSELEIGMERIRLLRLERASTQTQ